MGPELVHSTVVIKTDTVHVFHYEIGESIFGDTAIQKACNVWVIEVCQDLPFTAKAQQQRMAFSESDRHRLDGHLLLIKIVGAGRQINLTHAAFANYPK